MCNDDINSELKFVQKQFLCAVPIHKFNWLNIFDNFDWDLQEILINLTVNFDLVLNYPIKASYQNYFLKYIINRLEKQGSNPSDCVYNAFGRVVTLQESTPCYKHYLLKSGKIISLKENSNFISEGTTGLCSWQASLALSEWSLNNKELFKNKTILELGSGIGLTGLTIVLNCEPKQIYLTDCHLSVLEVLETNIKLNSALTSTVKVLNLPWENVTKNTVIPNIDILLAADVIYDSSIFSHLLNAINIFFKCKSTKILLIACTERNKNTLQEFLELLENNCLKYEEIETSPQLNFIWSTECPIRLFSVSSLQST